MWKDKALLQDMVIYAREAVGFVEGIDSEQFMTDRRTQMAVMHALVIVGEAAAQVSDEWRFRLPDVPWSKIVGMRNKLVHHYFKAELPVVWQTVIEYVPQLIGSLESLLSDMPDTPPTDSAES